MGKGRLITNLLEGQYTVEIDKGSAQIQALIAKLNADIARWTAAKADADTVLNDAEAKKTPLLAALDTAINDYRIALNAGEMANIEAAEEVINSAVQAVFDYEIEVQSAAIPVRSYEAQIAQAERQADYLLSFSLETVEDLWCADLTDDADIPGDYALIEIPGEPDKTIIAPGVTAHVTASDGDITARPAQSAEQLFFNLAILPGWQKFSPTYRVGTISNLKSDLDVTDVFLDNATSSAQSLSVNQSSALYGIPVEYMNCHAAAFADGDRVVVKFDGQNWENPKVIGFESNPKMCPVGRARLHRGLYTYPEPGVLQYYSQFFLNVKGVDDGGPGTDIINYMRADAQYSTYKLCIEYRMEGSTDFVKMVQYAYHSPSPWPEGPLGATYRGVGYSDENLLTGVVWIDDFYRYDDLGLNEGLAYDCAYGSGGNWDKTWKLHLGLNSNDFPGFENKYIEIRIHRKDDLKTPVLKKVVHFIYKYTKESSLVWGVEDIDALIVMPTFGGPDGKPITKYPDSFAGFPQPQPTPDYW